MAISQGRVDVIVEASRRWPAVSLRL